MRNPWTVLLGSAIAVTVGYSPAVQQTFGIFLKPMAASLGWQRTSVSLIYSLTPLLAAPLMIFVGTLVDRLGNRPIVVAQAIGVPLVLLLYSALQPSLAVFALLVVLGAVVNSLSTPASINSVLLQWFDKRLGMAMGLSMAALGIGTSLMPILASGWIEQFGWRGAFRLEAALVAAIAIPNALLLIHDNPAVLAARRKVESVAAGDDSTPQAAPAIDGFSARAVLRMPLFWRLAGCFLLMGLMFAGTSVHFVALMTDRGIDPQTAARAFGLMGVAQIAGRLLCAGVADRIPLIAFATLMYLLSTVAFAVLGFDVAHALYIAPVCLGIAAGVVVHSIGLIVRRWFGLRASGRVFSMIFTAFAVGAALGPLIMAFAYDRTGVYRVPLLAFCALSLIVAVVFAGVARHPQLAPRPAAS
ncbi:MAG: MFS transporter [Vicinamibacterales bacterium]